jgi:hypothetical protein
MAYTQTIILAVQTAAGNSADIDVGSIPVVVGVYAAAEPCEPLQVRIYRKNPAGNYQPVPDDSGAATFDQARREITFYAPGRYRLVKGVTVAAVGFFKDEG